jgi:hypothetical protein
VVRRGDIEEDYIGRDGSGSPLFEGFVEEGAWHHAMIASPLVNHLPDRSGKVRAGIPGLNAKGLFCLRMIPGKVCGRCPEKNGDVG